MPRVYKEEESKSNREYTQKKYSEWEHSIKSIAESNLTNSKRESINKTKFKNGKEVKIYDENNNSKYSAEASTQSPMEIIISRQQAENFELDYMNLNTSYVKVKLFIFRLFYLA